MMLSRTRPCPNRRFRLLRVLGLACALSFAAAPSAQAQDDAWSWLKGELFGDRPIADGSGWIALDAPYRAHDAAIVPIEITALKPQTAGSRIRAITLVIDENPAPLAAVFRFGPASPSASISTRVRVDAYSEVRAIAETEDGELLMVHRFVKASGGCSAPAGKDADQALANLGEMRLRQFVRNESSGPRAEAQLAIRHPNYSGLQMDQLTRHYIPAHFVDSIEVRQGGELVLAMEGGISLSENPSVRFRYRPETGRELEIRAGDTEGGEFTGSWPVETEVPKG